MDWLTQPQWSPYVVGVAIGVLGIVALLFSDKTIGCSTAFARTSGMLGRLLSREKVDSNPYYQQFRPVVDWEWMLVLGVVIGAFLSAALSGTLDVKVVPDRWGMAFGFARVPRLIVALLGGLVMGFGARWAGGCTSGHGISGTMQLAVSSWISAVCFFVGGIITAMVIFRLLA